MIYTESGLEDDDKVIIDRKKFARELICIALLFLIVLGITGVGFYGLGYQHAAKSQLIDCEKYMAQQRYNEEVLGVHPQLPGSWKINVTDYRSG